MQGAGRRKATVGVRVEVEETETVAVQVEEEVGVRETVGVQVERRRGRPTLPLSVSVCGVRVPGTRMTGSRSHPMRGQPPSILYTHRQDSTLMPTPTVSEQTIHTRALGCRFLL